MVVYVDCSNAANLKPPFGFPGTARPIPAQSRYLFARLIDIAWVKCDDITSATIGKDEFFVKGKEVEWFFILFSVYLFTEQTITPKLQEVDPPFYAEEEDEYLTDKVLSALADVLYFR